MAATLLALVGASLAKAGTLTYAVDVNTAALAANPGVGPFSLDFQWNYGSGLGNTVQIGGLQLTGGSLVAGTDTYLSGSGTGSLATSLSLTNSAVLPFNEFVQQLTSGVTDIKFNLIFSGPATGATPSGFSFAIDDGSTFPLWTTAPDTLSLASVAYTGGAGTIAGAFSSTAPSPLGVVATISTVPDAASTGSLLFGALMALGLGRRLRRKSDLVRA